MKIFLRIIPVCLLLIAGAGAGAGAGAAAAQSRAADPAGFVLAFGDKTATILRSRDLSTAEKDAKLRLLLTDSIDFARLSRFALGRFWQRATVEQRADFQQLFSNFVVSTYASLLSSQNADKFSVLEMPWQANADTVVRARIQRPSGEAIDTHWYVGRGDAGYRVYDITTAGISMAETYRSAVSSVAAVGGMPSLLAVLRARQ